MATYPETGALGANVLSVALIGPKEQTRMAVADALVGSLPGAPRQLPFYPDLDQVPKLIELNFDVMIIDLDSDPETALDLVESLCANSPATVMVYSTLADSELMIRCMRAGAREFLTLPLAPGTVAEAMVRGAVRRTTMKSPNPKRPDGKLCVFFGSKGGSGVTTVATNFAISVARESDRKTLLIDLDLPFGDVALGLGLTTAWSTADALQNYTRLDSNFLSRLLIKHDSGLWVLAAPGKVVNVPILTDAVNKLLAVARQDFEHVIVDTGSKLDLASTAMFEADALVYLVSQVGLSELRNSNRIISEFFKSDFPQLEIVLNRYMPSSLGIDEEHITKALTRRAQWKIPDDHGTVRKMQSAATPLGMGDSQISRVIRQMARGACGLAAEPEKKKKIIGLF
ncbi:MAG TPA: AAA family ATPase [Terracidiphilus sp.]